MQTLSVAVNGDGVHSIDAPDRITTDGPFEVAIDNRGQAAHVHLNVDDDLSRVAGVATTNHYLEAGSRRVIHVDVDPDRPETTIRGKIKLVVGHGSGSTYVTVTVEPPPERERSVVIDESLSEPPAHEPEPTPVERAARTVDSTLEDSILPAIAIAAIAAIVAITVGVTVQTPAVILGVAVVLIAVVVATVLLLR
ncbi:hypothetical protein ACERIT_08580 [Halopenitus sp. H-Gu1]|uniref:DUF7524 family protein n=1 Tax=Halopenitus sp. H-Gu1 TaxID=3242697 RepID=UPI00359D6330